jgi:hypothetical protein
MTHQLYRSLQRRVYFAEMRGEYMSGNASQVSILGRLSIRHAVRGVDYRICVDARELPQVTPFHTHTHTQHYGHILIV